MRALATVGLLLCCACPGSKEKIALSVLSEGCNINSDCSEPLVCAFRRCHQACTTTRDCSQGLSCVAPSDFAPTKVCLLPDETHCVYNTDCAAGLVCGQDGRCRTECNASRDCVREQVCVTGLCADTQELVDGGLVANPDAGSTGAARCTYDSDCTPLVCKPSVSLCLPECRADRDCASGRFCANGSCADSPGDAGSFPPDWGKSCLLNSECTGGLICGDRDKCQYECVAALDCPTASDCCVQHACRRGASCTAGLPDGGAFDAGNADAGAYCLNDLACDNSDFCAGIHLCVNNHCLAPLHPVCDDFNPCTIDMCNSVTRTCAYASSGMDAGDDDHDGHKAFECGFGADDCDDTNPNVYPGHPEDCDFIDNNCNGAIDEGLWRERPNARISLHGQARYPAWAGTPGVVKTDAGWLVAVSSDTIDGALEAFLLDRNLVLQQGPVPLFGSTTQWVTPPGMPTFYGRRLVRPQLHEGNGQVLATALVESIGGTTGCVAADDWSLVQSVMQLDSFLGVRKPWEPIDSDLSTTGCGNQVPESYYPSFSTPVLAWSASVGRWVALLGTRPGGTGTYTVSAEYFEPDGGVVNRHTLIPSPNASEASYLGYYYEALPPPFLGVGPNNAMAIWTGTAGRPRYVLLDASLNAPLTAVQDVFDPGQVVTAGYSPFGYYFVNRTSPADSLRLISPQTGALIGGPWDLRPHQPGPGAGSPYRGYDSTKDTPVIPFADGFAFIATSWPHADFGYLSLRNDGGVVTSHLVFPNVPRSGFAMAPIDDHTIGVVWTDGELKRTIMECVP